MSEGFSCPVAPATADRVLMSHGGGGRMSRRLIRDLFRRHFTSSELARDHDGAYLQTDGRLLAFTTDSFVVSPPFFPGGDIGSLAIHGTVNDLAACGARARWLSAAFVLEEGLPMSELERIVVSMAKAASTAGVEIVAGDTKVVERGKGDGIFITTTGIGTLWTDRPPDPRAVLPGDVVLLSGSIGEHGMAILSRREGLAFESELTSDSAPLGDLVEAVYRAGVHPRCLRDPTRGGVAAALAEIAEASQTGIELDESAIPVAALVRGACEILGLDPLLVANEGKMLFIVAPEDAETALAALRSHPLGKLAAKVGRVQGDEPGCLLIRTELGSVFVMDIPAGEELPRIC